MRYADPALCPDCRAGLPRGTTTCPTCGLLVRHRVAAELFGTLQRADALVAELRALSDAATDVRRVPVTVGGATGALPTLPVPAPPVLPPVVQGRGVRFASVPKILLGAGALCLLVAAVIFLAVSWSSLGVGGRTSVLVGLTAGTAGSSLWLNRHDLRIAAESLMTVALGLLTLDLLGAESAGWLGDPSAGAMAIVVGVVLAMAGTLAALARPEGGPRLLAPQVAAALGLLVLYAGAVDVTAHVLLSGHAVVAAGIGAAWLVRGQLRIQAAGLAAVTGAVWTVTTFLALVDALADPTVTTMWHEGAGTSLLVSGAFLLVPGGLLRRPELVVVGASGAALLVTATVTVPFADEGARWSGLVALIATGGWVAVARLLPARLRAVGLVPAACGSAILAVTTAATAATAGSRVLDAGRPLSRGVDVALAPTDVLTEPALAVPSVLVVLAFAAVAVGDRVTPSVRLLATGASVGAAGVVTLASYDVPLAAVVAALAALGLLATAAGVRARSDLCAATGLLGSAAALVASLPSAGLTSAAAVVVTACAAVAHLRGRSEELRTAGGAVLPAGSGLVVWAGGYAAGYQPEALGVPVLVVVGLLAIGRPRTSVETSAAVVGGSGALVAVASDLGSLALQLTVAGALLCTTALVHRSRRQLGHVGGGLLFLATWVRLGELGVTEPEPYTLPLAVALTVAGIVHLHRDPGAGTATALLPGLLLGTTPSLLWVMADPVSVRALVLGAGCLVLAVAGAGLRWSAPLVVGAGTGAAIVVRELGPYAGDAPQWVWIALAGTLLIVVGITWERRLLELRNAVGLLGRLR